MTRAVRSRVLVNVAAWHDLDAATAYGILQLRATVFVVEQHCAYLDPDGRDLEPGARQVWIEHDGQVVSTLRVLDGADGQRIGRVATHASHRGRGHASALIRRAVDLASGPVVLAAQAHLVSWYESLGFTVSGAPWVEDGIDHVPMRRGPAQTGALIRPRR